LIVPNRKYTYAELEKIRAEHPDLAARFAKAGYVWRMDLDGTMMMVHHTQATGGGGTFGKPQERPDREFATDTVELTSEALPRIVKRTPKQRMESLMSKIKDDFVAGRVLTLDEVNTHRPDRPKADRLDGEVVREVAQAFMEQAEAVNEEAESKKVTRTAPTD